MSFFINWLARQEPPTRDKITCSGAFLSGKMESAAAALKQQPLLL
jgi:hypothetical protein